MCAPTPRCYWIFFYLTNIHESHFISSWKQGMDGSPGMREGKKRARQNSLSLITQQIRIKGFKIEIQFLPHQRSIRTRGFIEETSSSAKHGLIEILFHFYSEYNFTSGPVGGFALGIHGKQLRVSWMHPWSSQLGLQGVRADPREWAQKASDLLLI